MIRSREPIGKDGISLASASPSNRDHAAPVRTSHDDARSFDWEGSTSHLRGAVYCLTTIAVVAAAHYARPVLLPLVSAIVLATVGDLFLQKLIQSLPRWRDKRDAFSITREIQQKIATYLFTVSIVNLGFGAVVGVGLLLAGMPNAFMWGALAALLNYVPYFGPVAGVLIIGVAGLLGAESMTAGLIPASIYFACHLIEANLVTPFVLGRRCALNPVVVFISLFLLNWLWGVLGALLAVPLLVACKVFCERVDALGMLGAFISGVQERAAAKPS